MIEDGNQAGHVELVEPWNGTRRMVPGIDAVDAALVGAGADVEFLLPARRQPVGMTDDAAIHVGDPKGAVRSGAGHDGTEPRVGRGEEFALAFVGRPFAGEGDAVERPQDFAMDQVVYRLAHEPVFRELRSKKIVAIN